MCYSHVDVWFILIHSHHFNTYVSFQKDCLCVHHPDVLPNLMQLLAKWFLQQSNCAAVEMTIFSTKGDKIFSTRVASFTSCGLSQDWSTSWVNIGQLLEADFGHSLYSCSHPFFWGPAIWSIPKPEQRKMNSESHDFGTAVRPASKNILQIGPSTPCSVRATSGGDFETSYNFYCIRSPM